MRKPKKPPFNLVPCRNWHLQYLAEHMRPDEIRHFLAFSGAPHYEPDTAASAFMQTGGLKMTVLSLEGVPLVSGGFYRSRGNAWEGWLAGTMDAWENHYRVVSRSARWLMGEVFRMGATRISIMTIAERTSATDWYQRVLGMQLDGTLRHAGCNGEDVVIYSRLGEMPR